MAFKYKESIEVNIKQSDANQAVPRPHRTPQRGIGELWNGSLVEKQGFELDTREPVSGLIHSTCSLSDCCLLIKN